jgi:type IV pilus assembly protein PilW
MSGSARCSMHGAERIALQRPCAADSGLTLVELMVALAISSILVIGATTIYMQGRTTFRVNQSVARLHEDARFVLDTLEPDIRMAGYFGLRSRAERVQGHAGPLSPVPAALAVAGDCGVNWSINIENEVEGDNNSYGWNGCAPFGAGAAPDTDTLIVRRVAEDPDIAAAAGTLYIQSARFRDSELFAGPTVPPGFPNESTATHRLIANGYYVSRSSDADAQMPSLRVKALVGSSTGPKITDTQILRGVEDIQIQFGVDTDAIGTPDRGSVNRYVDPDDPMIDPLNPLFDPNAEIIAVRLWLRIRAERRENGFTDDATYVYADRNVGPFNDSFRRIVVTKTVFLRNARKTT